MALVVREQTPRRRKTPAAVPAEAYRVRIDNTADGSLAARRREVRPLLDDAFHSMEQGRLLAAADQFRSILSIDPGCIAALDGLDRIRMDPTVSAMEVAMRGANQATNEVAHRVLSLWQREDPTEKAAAKLLKLARSPASQPSHGREADCCGGWSLATCVTNRRLDRARQRQIERVVRN